MLALQVPFRVNKSGHCKTWSKAVGEVNEENFHDREADKDSPGTA
jgi:hypothetical protein